MSERFPTAYQFTLEYYAGQSLITHKTHDAVAELNGLPSTRTVQMTFGIYRDMIGPQIYN